jgi:hypothetical protein
MSSAWGRLLCLIIVLQAPSALAQTAMGQPVAASRSGDPAYDGLIDKAVIEFTLGHWGEARAFFLRAHQLRPNARTLRSLGHTSYELRLYVDAIGYFRQALRSEEQPLTPQLRTQVEQQLAEARSFVTRIQLALEPSSVTVRVDGHEPVFDDDGTLLLDPGPHELSAAAPEYEPQVRAISAHGAERLALTFNLGPVPSLAQEQPLPMLDDAPIEPEPEHTPTASAAAPPATPKDQAAPYPSTPQWIGIGLGAAGVVAGGVALGFSLAAVHENNVSERSCTAKSCDDAGRDARKSALTHADIATVSVIVAGALVASGAVCYFTSTADSERESASWRVSPVASHRTAGLMLSGQF